ncbi:WD repeat containing cyclophilin family peptidyl-prolyl cis-trans isomerase Cyp9 [Schizosaccharomyces pombe]
MDGASPVDRDVSPVGLPKKRIKQNHDQVFLHNLPDAPRYTKSYMHNAEIYKCFPTKSNYILSVSYDGYVKFWHKTPNGVEYIKEFHAHNAMLLSAELSQDERLFITGADDKSLKVFDVESIDLVNIIDLEFLPKAICCFNSPSLKTSLIAVSSAESPLIFFFESGGDGEVLYTVKKHTAPVHCLRYLSTLDCFLSIDIGGMVEYWSPEEPFQKPDTAELFNMKSQTDLYIFKKQKSVPTSLEVSHFENFWSTISYPDCKVRVFDTKSGRAILELDENPSNAAKKVEALFEKEDTESSYYMSHVELGRRIAIERDIEKHGLTVGTTAIFDESEKYLLYGSIVGIKVVSIDNGTVVRIYGKDEAVRFTRLSLYQQAPKKSNLPSLDVIASNNPLVEESFQKDPTLFATAWKKQRFYLFSNMSTKFTLSDRDVYNEQVLPVTNNEGRQENGNILLGKAAIIHTTQGDISIKLYPEEAPKAVQNFTTHAENGYYDNTIFHRIIKNFMIQGGDPLGDGTGGESIWKKDFEDEISPNLKHDRPFTVSMANSGPNTNGSQFFITTDLTPWLDGKHTIFARAYAGLDVVHRIEQGETDKYDRPLEPTKIINISIVYT